MRALVVSEFAPPEHAQIQEVDAPAPGPQDVVIEVKAAGVGFVDGLIVQGLYQVKPPLPFIPGGEIAGVISDIGTEVETLKPGDRVMTLAPAGGFAEKAKAKALGCIPIPDNLSFEAAAGFTVSYCTGLYGLKDQGNLKKGETVLVLGAAGGVGLAAIDIAKALGANVIAAASTEEKRALCIAQGADETVDYTQEDWRQTVKDLTDGNGVDVVYDPVGGSMSELALRSLGHGGRHLVIGFAAGEIPRIPLNLPLLKRCQIVGVDWGGWMREDPSRNIPLLTQLLEWVAMKHLNPPQGQTYPLDNAPQALRDLLDRKVLGKAVIVP